ncbi:MAG: metallophosphoesterase [Fibrobacteres bacterium]|nr:metallophosphoesterase [Fibrobacterota bacterium]
MQPPSTCHHRPASRLVAVGDIHGNFDGWIRILRQAELLDGRGAWIGGDATLVMTGDVVGRGGYPKRIYLWLRRLMREASAAGGRVEFVLGNHESMSMHHIHSYTTVEEYRDFAPPSELDQFELRSSLATLPSPGGGDPQRNAAMLDISRMQEEPLGWLEFRRALAPTGMVGRWLVRRPNLFIAGKTLFVHGGLHPRYAIGKPEDLDQRIRGELARLVPYFELDARNPALAEDGPHWYRIALRKSEAALTIELEETLGNWNLDRMVVGHTPTFLIDPRSAGKILSKANGRLMCIDVGIGKAYGARLAALELTPDGNATAIYPDGRQLL